MKTVLLSDKSIQPTDDIIFSVIGDTEPFWKQTFSCLFDQSKDISVNWKYSDCGKYWVCVVQKKKNTIFRLRILKMNSFNLAFPFGDTSEPFILQSKLPESIKNDFINAKRFNATRYISIAVEGSKDIENVKKLIALKLNNKDSTPQNKTRTEVQR